MIKEYLPQLKILRDHITIGYTDDIQLLKDFEGNIENIVAFLKEKYVSEVELKTRLSRNLIIPVLLKYNYDYKQTIRILEDEYYLIDGEVQTFTAYNLFLWEIDKGYLINLIATRIEKQHNLKRPNPISIDVFYWLREEALIELNPYHLCLVSLNEWNDYLENEGFGYALYYNTKLVIQQFQKLGLNNLAAAIKISYDVKIEIDNLYDTKTIEGQIESNNMVKTMEDYIQAEKYFHQNWHEINNKLYDFIKTNVHQFP